MYDRDRQYKEDLPKTAGSALYGKLGFETSYKRLSLRTELMVPACSNLAGGDIEARSRFSVFINLGI